jgi:hypothetical protein
MRNKAISKLCFDEGQVGKNAFIFHATQHHHHPKLGLFKPSKKMVV